MVLLGVAFWEYQRGFDGSSSKTGYAISDCNKLIRACDAYRLKPQANGKLPARLMDLVVPPEGMTAVLDGGPNAIRDPWGNAYLYAVGESDAGPVAYVWCAREENGKLRGFGSRLTPDGKIRRFTISDN